MSGYARLLIAVLLACALPAAAQVPHSGRPGDTEIITNYWKHLSKILELEQAAPVEGPPDPNLRFPPPKQYSFDAVQHLNTAELRRAAVEGIKDAQSKLAGQPEEVVNRQIKANLLIALQYYPLAATRVEDFQKLIFMLEDGSEHPVLRRLILERLAPGLAPPTLLSDYLQSNFSREADRISAVVGKIATSTIEDAEIQVLGMELLYLLRMKDYTELLNSDSNVRVHVEKTGKPLRPMDMKKPGAPVLSKAIELQFNNMTNSFKSMADRFAEHFDPLRKRPKAVQDKARELINRIADTVPLPDPDAVRQLAVQA